MFYLGQSVQVEASSKVYGGVVLGVNNDVYYVALSKSSDLTDIEVYKIPEDKLTNIVTISDGNPTIYRGPFFTVRLVGEFTQEYYSKIKEDVCKHVIDLTERQCFLLF